MAKPFKSLNTLLRLMRNRNISIDKDGEGSKVKRILSRENYYSVINGYKDIFLDLPATHSSGDDYYISGTTFFHIYALYCFDRNLRSILLKYLLQAEQNVCTKVAYRFSESYQSEFSHLNINNFSRTNLPSTTKLISKLSNTTQKNAKNGAFYHYLTEHQDLPLWVLVTKLTFGEINSFYKSMLPTLQEKVLEDINKEYGCEFNYQITTPTSTLIDTFKGILETLLEYRNICAHGERLYNHRVKTYNQRNRTTVNKKLGHYFINAPRGSEASIYGVLISLRLFLPKAEYRRLLKDVIAEIILLSKGLPTAQFNQVLAEMELTLNWKQTLDNLKQ